MREAEVLWCVGNCSQFTSSGYRWWLVQDSYSRNDLKKEHLWPILLHWKEGRREQGKDACIRNLYSFVVSKHTSLHNWKVNVINLSSSDPQRSYWGELSELHTRGNAGIAYAHVHVWLLAATLEEGLGTRLPLTKKLNISQKLKVHAHLLELSRERKWRTVPPREQHPYKQDSEPRRLTLNHK